MDADRTPSARGRPTEPSSERGVGGAGTATRPIRTVGTLTDDDGTDRLGAGDVRLGEVLPDRSMGRDVGRPVPEAADLFDELVSRRRSPIAQAAVRRPVSPVPSTDRRTRARIRPGWAYAVVIVALAVAVAVGATSRAHLHRTDTQLTAVRARLHQTVGRARVAESALGAVTGQATAAARVLATETQQLASVQSQLAATEANVFANGVSINDLDTCLSGVEQALNEISLGDQHGAATTLNGVAASCRAATPAP